MRDPRKVTSDVGEQRLDFVSKKAGTFPLVLNYHRLGQSSPEDTTKEFEITIQ